MKHSINDNDLFEAHSAFHRDHTRLRTELLASLSSLPAIESSSRRVNGRMTWIAISATVCLSVIVIAWLATSGLGSRKVYALEGIQERFLRIRSLHVKGSIHRTLEINGEKVEKSIPLEWYAERPSKYFHSWNSTEDDGQNVRFRTGMTGADEDHSFFVSDDNQQVVRGKSDRLSTELKVEFLLQNQLVQQMIGGPTANFQLIGTEMMNGKKTNKFESLREAAHGQTRNAVWLDPITGMPVRSLIEVLDSKGGKIFSMDYESIEVNVPPPANMFPYKPPEDYHLVETEERNISFDVSSGGAGKDLSAVRYAFAIDRRAVLICWHHRVEGDAEPDPDIIPVIPELELQGDGGTENGKTTNRKCEHHLIQTQSENGQLWRWSLAIPLDRRPINPDEVFSINFHFPSGSQSSDANYPLILTDEQLKNAISAMRELGKPVGKPKPEMNLVRLRWLTARYLSGESDDEASNVEKK